MKFSKLTVISLLFSKNLHEKFLKKIFKPKYHTNCINAIISLPLHLLVYMCPPDRPIGWCLLIGVDDRLALCQDSPGWSSSGSSCIQSVEHNQKGITHTRIHRNFSFIIFFQVLFLKIVFSRSTESFSYCEQDK